MRAVSRIALVLFLALLVISVFAFPARGNGDTGASLSLTKTPSATSVVGGSTVSYLFNVTNTGGNALSGNITDDVFGLVGSFIGLSPGGWVAFNVSRVLWTNTTNVATAIGEDSFGGVATDCAVAFVRVHSPNVGIRVTKTCEPDCQPAPGSVTWNVTVANTGDLPLVGINVTDSRHGLLGSVGTLDPGLSVYFLINETGLPAGVYTDNATAYGAFQPDSGPYVVISDSGIAECRVGPDFVIPEVPFGTIMVSATMIFALGAFVAFPKLRRKREYPKS